MSGPPRRLLLAAVPDYVKERFGKDISRQSAYNWVSVGRNNVKLRIAQVVALGGPHTMVRVTYTNWVDEFVSRMGGLA
jgi:negative regulator of sigma E activity